MAVMASTAACGKKEEKRAEADQAAAKAGFVPPSVTSRIDFGSMMARRFRELDRDGNDVITVEEMPRANSRLWELDRNKDGEITESEFFEGMLARFDRMDLNRDGTVTSEEREASRTERPATPNNPVGTGAGTAAPGNAS
ncbi:MULTISPECIES: EF-hand domain-containing protein [unclassified Sphingomonas]|uniref:EF-hand domain-containing protein n=1 Tax=Sphingomonas TaxID=13687 RepID=UPI002A6AE8C9|nr:EF-hand domain-containing protein [Sphingomonas sp. CFBP8993]MDY0959483.1 EF-hand domain-containing protein [Sphingomonas sp. CFBP8993]